MEKYKEAEVKHIFSSEGMPNIAGYKPFVAKNEGKVHF